MSGIRDVAELVTRAAAESPDRLAVVEAGGRSLTWAELEDEVGRIATGLAGAGILGGHRVLIALGNRIEFVTTYLGVLRAQAVAVPVNPLAAVGELARMIADSGARMVVADADTVVARARGGRRRWRAPPRLVVVGATLQPGERGYDQLRAQPARPAPPLQDPEKLAALLYTSGTSGLPRAAMLTHRALLANIEQVAQVEPPMMHGDDVVLGVLPLFHVYGLNAVLGGVLRHRRQARARRAVRPAGDAGDHRRRGVQRGARRAAGLRLLARRARPEGAARSGPADAVRLGAAEPRGRARVQRAHRRTRPPGLRPHRGVAGGHQHPVQRDQPGRARSAPRCRASSIRLVDDDGRPPEGDDPGEIEIRGANLFSGYWPDGAGGPDADGWWPTGDVGFLDDGGDLFLVDRLKELVIVSGFNVYPVEVEDVIEEVAGVAEVAVIGVADEQTGEAVVAYVRAPGADAGRDRRGGARALRRTAGAVQAAVPDRGRRRAAAHGHRQGPEGPAAGHRAAPGPGAAGVTSRDDGPGSRSTPARAATSATTPGR